MRYEISAEQLHEESSIGYKPTATDASFQSLPLSMLSDREFETLCYKLVKREIESGLFTTSNKIALMQGVGERGRDCTLYLDSISNGVIQCKKYAARLTLPQILKELIKLLLHSILDESIIPDPESFTYYIYSSNDCTEQALKLIYGFSNEIGTHIKNGTIEKYAKDVSEDYEAFIAFRSVMPMDEINKLLRSISLQFSNLSDLSGRVSKHTDLLQEFFKIRTVIDNSEADRIVRKALADHGLKLLTDADLKIIQQRVGQQVPNKRVRLGLADFFGFSTEFFRYLQPEELKSLLKQVAEIKMTLNTSMLNFIDNQVAIMELRYCRPLVARNEIHRFSSQVWKPYLFRRLASKCNFQDLPKALIEKYFPDTILPKDIVLKEISEILLDTADKVLKRDYSDMYGEGEFLAMKIRLLEKIHDGIESLEQAKILITRDLKTLMPIMDEVESKLELLLPTAPTIIIKEGDYFDDPEQLAQIMADCEAIDRSKPPKNE
ncbi:hypothetical protein ALP03_00051 [Pseudomonas amygdali pv. tabaci]|uniref:Restriction endonuclease type IV Mrr domain-containing protein n=1 Tax=Pseudomonas amygdali pv. tabaci TaxID=322 RepID=A0A3M6HY82_PSEAJ|nr:hypothetical protein ALP03_00051 [Pseudomonas amygdali pv. tabaci]